MVTQDQQKPSPAVTFVDVNVVPMDSERILYGQTVVVRGRTIEQMGPVAEVPVPRDAELIEAKGKYLLPGLADMHAHNMNKEDFALFLANGVTIIRNMWGAPKHLRWRQQIADGELLGPTIITTSPLIDGSPPAYGDSVVIETAAEAQNAVIEYKNEGYDAIKVYDRLKPEVFDAIIAEAKKQEMPVVGHVPWAVDLEHALKSGMASIEHLMGYMEALQDDESPLSDQLRTPARIENPRWNFIDGWRQIDEAKIPGIVEAVVESGVWNCVTLVVFQGFVSTEVAERLFMQPGMKSVPRTMRNQWKRAAEFFSKNLTEDDFDGFRKADEIRSNLTSRIHEAGGRILLGTDTPNVFTIPGFSIHAELANLVIAGLTPYEAIRSGTANPAEFLGVETFGIVAPGKRADLVLVERNPLENIANLKEIAGVMAGGRWVPAEELQSMLDDVASSYEPPANRFLEVPPLPEEGETQFTGRFRIKDSGTTIGEDRFVLAKRPDGKLVVHAQYVMDPPCDTSATLRLVFDESGKCYSLQYENETSDGIDEVKMERIGTTLTVSGSLSSGMAVDFSKVVREDILLGTLMNSSFLPVAEVAKSLEIGETKEVRGELLQMRPSFSVSDQIMTIHRTTDGTVQTANGEMPVQIFHVKVISDVLPFSFVMTLDDERRLFDLDFKFPAWKLRASRID